MKRILSLLCLGVLAAGTLAAQAPRPVAPAPPAAGEVVLRPGDAVLITVWRQPELSGEFTLAADGSIDHPLYRKVQVGGVPIGAARERLHGFLREWEAAPEFLLKPLFRVAVGGEVQKPSLYTFAPEITIAQAVAAAGGVTERGRLNRVRVLRAGGETLVLDLTRGEGGLREETVRSGDQIFIERTRAVTFRDYIAPAGTIAMAAVTLISVLTR